MIVNTRKWKREKNRRKTRQKKIRVKIGKKIKREVNADQTNIWIGNSKIKTNDIKSQDLKVNQEKDKKLRDCFRTKIKSRRT